MHPRSWEGGNSSKNQGTSSVEKRRGETNGKHRRCEEGPSSARQPLCTGSGRPAEKGEDSSPAVASASQQDHPRKPNKRQDRAARPRGASQKRRTHQLRDRCSPAGSSRPGSAKGEVACADQSSLHRHTPRSKVTQDKLIGGVSSGLPLSTEASRSGCKQLYEDICASPETGVAHGPPPGQCMNIHLLPVEQTRQRRSSSELGEGRRVRGCSLPRFCHRDTCVIWCPSELRTVGSVFGIKAVGWSLSLPCLPLPPQHFTRYKENGRKCPAQGSKTLDHTTQLPTAELVMTWSRQTSMPPFPFWRWDLSTLAPNVYGRLLR